MPAVPVCSRRRMLAMPAKIGVAGALATALAAFAGCGSSGSGPAGSGPGGSSGGSPSGSGKLVAVASIDAWGSILTQLGGDRVLETSIISSPDVDPHDYEPTAADARLIAGAQVLVVNGIGYDSWAAKSAAANPSSARRLVDVGDIVGLKEGDNPHQWYSAVAVRKVIDAITAALQAAAPQDSEYFAKQRQSFLDVALKPYFALEDEIRTADSGVPVGASESVASPLVESLGLDMLTPYSFLKAVSEGTDPSPADIATINDQLAGKQLRVYLDNVQNSTPDVAAQVKAAEKANIPVVTLTETLSPKGSTFQEWQIQQLTALRTALGEHH